MEQNPDMEITGQAKTNILAIRPVKQIPTVIKVFSDSKPQNIAAWLMQATGELLPLNQSCSRCQKGAGIFGRQCVVMPDADMKERTLNTCANCWYNRNGVCSTVRWGNSKHFPFS